jgi:very-short-patch-repair endonuclease
MRLPAELPQDLRHRPFTVEQARSAGLTQRRLRARDLMSPCTGVRVSATAEETLLLRVAAVGAVTGAVVSHISAALLWGFPLPLACQTNEIHLTCPLGRRALRRKGVVGHQLDLEPAEIIPGRHVQCTSPLRTWFDLAGMLGHDDLVIAGDFLFRRRNPLSSLAELDRFLSGKVGKPGCRNAMRARTLLRANTDSPKETEVRLLLRRHGLPEPAINVPLFDEAGRWIQDPDMSYDREKVAIQYDGAHHASAAQRRSDIFRDEDAKEAGWRVVVLTQLDLETLVPAPEPRPYTASGMEPRAVTRIRKALMERGWAPKPARRRRASGNGADKAGHGTTAL